MTMIAAAKVGGLDRMLFLPLAEQSAGNGLAAFVHSCGDTLDVVILAINRQPCAKLARGRSMPLSHGMSGESRLPMPEFPPTIDEILTGTMGPGQGMHAPCKRKTP
jgi:hypothetical protein